MQAPNTSDVPKVFRRSSLWTLRALSASCLCLSVYLSWLSATHTSGPGCGAGTGVDCDNVWSSVWSHWLGMPVALLGVGVYASITFVSAGTIGPTTKPTAVWKWYALIFLGTVAATAASWFIGGQVFIIRSICVYCMATHLLGISVAANVLLLSMSVVSRPSARPPDHTFVKASLGLPGGRSPSPDGVGGVDFIPVVGCALAGTAVVFAFVIVQILWPGESYREFAAVKLPDAVEADAAVLSEDSSQSPAAPHDAAPATKDAAASKEQSGNEPPRPVGTLSTAAPALARSPTPRPVSFIGGQLTVDMGVHPVLGVGDAPNVIVELVDYTCPTCRQLHALMKQGRSAFGDQLAVIVLVVPLHPDCNATVKNLDESHADACRLARLSLALWRHAPEAFTDFHDWLLDGNESRRWEDALDRATEHVPRETLEESMRSAWVDSQLRYNTSLFAKIGANTESALPIHIVKSRVLVGAPGTPEQLFAIWQRELDIQRRDTSPAAVP
ncbi:MAG: vitamin K epoxide reductase family protein [Pirellulales bacterium]